MSLKHLKPVAGKYMPVCVDESSTILLTRNKKVLVLCKKKNDNNGNMLRMSAGLNYYGRPNQFDQRVKETFYNNYVGLTLTCLH